MRRRLWRRWACMTRETDDRKKSEPVGWKRTLPVRIDTSGRWRQYACCFASFFLCVLRALCG
jgi:hypothetical protein